MPIQITYSDGDHGMLDPSRDLVHAMPQLVRETALRFERGTWPELLSWMMDPPVGMTVDEINAAGITVANFCASCLDDPKESMKDVLARCGWFDNKAPAQVGYLAMLGTALMSYYFNGCRDAAVGGRKPNRPFEEIVRDWANLDHGK